MTSGVRSCSNDFHLMTPSTLYHTIDIENECPNVDFIVFFDDEIWNKDAEEDGELNCLEFPEQTTNPLSCQFKRAPKSVYRIVAYINGEDLVHARLYIAPTETNTKLKIINKIDGPDLAVVHGAKRLPLDQKKYMHENKTKTVLN